MPCVSLTLAARAAAGFFIHVTQRCVQCEWSGGGGGDVARPFWEPLTLGAKGWVRLSSAVAPSRCDCVDIDPETAGSRAIFVPAV